MFVPVPENSLTTAIVKQIDYYFRWFFNQFIVSTNPFCFLFFALLLFGEFLFIIWYVFDSDVNLAKKDDYLQLQMDEQGWVPISVIANFPRVS